MAKQCANCQAEIPVSARSCPECSSDVGGALSHIRVLDLTGPGTQYGPRILGDLGADVVRVEPPEGDVGRHMKPFAGETPDPERSLTFLTFNLNKRGVMLDLAGSGDQERFRSLVSAADILLEDGTGWDLNALGLGYESLKESNPGLIYTSISPFGLWGPYKNYQGGELIVQALGGLMYGYGDPDARPAIAPLAQGHQLASQHAVWASLVALRHRNQSGQGQHIEVSVQEVLANILAYLGRYANGNQINRRLGSTTNLAPTNTYPCADGYVYMQPGYPRHVESLYEWMDNDILKDDIWKDRDFRRANSDVLTSLIADFSIGFPKLEFHREAQRRHIPTSPLMTVRDLVQDEQLRYSKYFLEIDHPVVGKYETPGHPFRMGESPGHVYYPAPRLGEHTEEVLKEWTVNPPERRGPAPSAVPAGNGNEEPPLPLKGFRILDFSRVWAGPFMTRYFAELGADIIKVESEMLPDRAQAQGAFSFNFSEIQRGKRSITLNMSHEGSIALVERLVEQCDVVLENFRAGVLEGWGIGYQRMKQVNPRIIYLSMPGFGNSGPNVDFLSYGQSLLAYTGLMDMWAHPESDGRTRPKVPLPDFIAAASGACALLSALEYRDRTGKGQMIELAQLEGLVSNMGVAFADYSLNDRVWDAWGNWDPNAAPHDVFPCQGYDAWCAIACYKEEQWQALVTVLESPAWTEDPRFATMEGRLANLEELNANLGAWTRDRTPHEAMRALQGAGVPAGVVSSGENLYYDLNLRARDYIVTVDHSPYAGVMEHPGATVRLSATPSRVVGPCPELGSDNQAIYGGLLGIPDEEIQRLIAERIIY